MEKISTQNYEKYIKALTDISGAITSDLYLEDILKLIVMVTARVTGLEICSLWLVDETETPRKLRLKATQSIDQEYMKDRSLSENEGVVGYVFSKNEPLYVKDVLTEPRFKEKDMARKLGLVSMLGVPLRVKNDTVIGVLNCFSSQPREFTDTEINLITAVANQAAVAIYNTELLVKSKVIQEELETRKLVEKAKDVLMTRRKMAGDEAFRWLQKRSMTSRKSMRQIAEAVLLSEELG
jgi:two-component system, response regulator PdtaR